MNLFCGFGVLVELGCLIVGFIGVGMAFRTLCTCEFGLGPDRFILFVDFRWVDRFIGFRVCYLRLTGLGVGVCLVLPNFDLGWG